MKSPRRPGSSIAEAATSTSCGMGLPSSAAFSKSATSARISAWVSTSAVGLLLDELDAHEEVRVGLDELEDAEALLALDERLGGAVGELELLHDRGDAADLVEVLGAGVLGLGVLLGDERDHMVARASPLRAP